MVPHPTDPLPLTRRRVLVTVAAGGLAAAWPGLLSRVALATPEKAQELIQKLATGTPKPGRITLKAPEIAENGATVPVTIAVESPMQEADYVRAVHVVSEGNPNPGLATFHFTPLNGRAEVQVRVRLAQSQNLVAVAEMSDGSLWTAAREIKVTIGGCGG